MRYKEVWLGNIKRPNGIVFKTGQQNWVYHDNEIGWKRNVEARVFEKESWDNVQGNRHFCEGVGHWNDIFVRQ